MRLTRGTDVRRIPFWLHVSRTGSRAAEAATPLGQARAAHRRHEREAGARVAATAIPDVPPDGVVSATLQGPEQVFRVTLTKPAANFGVVDHAPRRRAFRSSRGSSSQVTRTGSPATRRSPSTSTRTSSSSAIPCSRRVPCAPLAGAYDVVFDSPTAAGAGSFDFRYWLNDTTPPTLKLLQPRVSRGTPLAVRVTDAGSGVDPTTVKVTVDGSAARASRCGTA